MRELIFGTVIGLHYERLYIRKGLYTGGVLTEFYGISKTVRNETFQMHMCKLLLTYFLLLFN